PCGGCLQARSPRSRAPRQACGGGSSSRSAPWTWCCSHRLRCAGDLRGSRFLPHCGVSMGRGRNRRTRRCPGGASRCPSSPGDRMCAASATGDTDPPAAATGSTSTSPAPPRKAPAPVLVYFHAGTSSKMIGAHPLIYRLAAGGWVCVSAARRQFHANGADQLDDVRAALAWVRRHAESYGGDPDRIVAAGGSAGAGLAAAAALTGSKVAALICLYGYYGLV